MRLRCARRSSPADLGRVLWQPFSSLSSRLLPQRHSGGLEFLPASQKLARLKLTADLGEPEYEDYLIVVYRVQRVSSSP